VEMHHGEIATNSEFYCPSGFCALFLGASGLWVKEVRERILFLLKAYHRRLAIIIYYMVVLITEVVQSKML
jgi:hypothetical protein